MKSLNSQTGRLDRVKSREVDPIRSDSGSDCRTADLFRSISELAPWDHFCSGIRRRRWPLQRHKQVRRVIDHSPLRFGDELSGKLN